MACREYTLPRIEGSSQPKGWIQENTRIGPVLEITTNCLYGKHGIEIRIWSLSEDNSQSWVRISHGSNKFVMDWNRNDTEVLELQPEEQTLQLNVKDSACRSKANAKPQTREPVGYSLTEHHSDKWKELDWLWTRRFFSLRTRFRRKSSIFFDTIKELRNIFRINFPQTTYWSDDCWKTCLAAGGGAKRRYQHCTDISGTILYLRALQGHSGRNLIDPLLQDIVIIQCGFFQHIYHIGCAF